MAKVFVLDDGVEEIVVNNKFGEEICKLHIPAGDIGIIDRYKVLVNKVEGMMEPLKSLHINNDGTSDVDEDWEKIKAVESDLIGMINETFDMKDGGNLFATRNAFSTINGVFYVEKVLDMLGDIVSQAIEDEGKKASKRVDKYTKNVKK